MGGICRVKLLVMGKDARRIVHIGEMLSRGGSLPANPVLARAISAIDIALWDILGKSLNVPIYQLLGGLVRDKVPCYPHNQTRGDSDDVTSLVENCQEAVAEGWKFVRWGLPQQGDVLEPVPSIRVALKQMEAVRP